jgi:succinate dehydrogenase/fumarate reductase flavoprotein subunit
MGTWHDYLKTEGTPPEWPYPIQFGEEKEIETDVLVLGGGIAGCWAAISAARQGAKVVLLEKGDVKRSGAGGPGCDHWCNVPANPLSRVDPDDWAIQEMEALGNFSNGIGIQIQCREDYDTLLEMEQMGGKIRDTDDEFVGAEGRDDETKFMVSPRYTRFAGYAEHPGWDQPDYNPPETRKNTVLRIWGSTFKPILKKECLKQGVRVMDRVMATSLLNEGGVQGARVVGATGVNVRTGEFLIVKAKAVIMSTAGSGSLWMMDMEHGGYSSMFSRNESGDSSTMAFRAGATLTMMEGSNPYRIATGLKHKWYTGGGDASYENVPIVDANNVKLDLVTQGWADAGAMNSPDLLQAVRDGVESGKFELPMFGDFAGMKPEESNATWNLMLNEESTTKIMVKTMTEGGFDHTRDQIMNYSFIEMQSPPQYYDAPRGGGILHDWNLKTTLDGPDAAGTAVFSPEDHSFAASTGRYAGRKAAAYAKTVELGEVCREQIAKEKERVLAPAMRSEGIEWKELHNGLCRVMQYYVSQYKTERLYNLALEEIARIEENAVPQLYALDPHKLMRSLETLSAIESAKIIIYAQKERKLSSPKLGINRLDYPEPDEEELKKYLLMHLENDEVVFERIPIRFWGNMKEQYEAHNQDYTGVYKG